MNLKEFTLFLEKFDIKKENIQSIISDKQILIKNNGNLILTNQKIKDNEINLNEIIFIKLKKLLPTKSLLKIISKNSNNNVEINQERRALDFTYSKELNLNSLKKKIKLNENKYYVVKFNNNILGYIEFKNNKLINKMNIGEYLKEN